MSTTIFLYLYTRSSVMAVVIRTGPYADTVWLFVRHCHVLTHTTILLSYAVE